MSCCGQATAAHAGMFADESAKHGGTAIVITGAASRIPQEAALLEQLYKTGWLKDVSFISGASSGAINTVILNAILNHTFSWERYKNILFGIKNGSVYDHSNKKLPLDTQPLRELLTSIVNDTLGYNVIGDLPFPSAISATSVKLVPFQKHTLRFSNRAINPESNPNYNLIDIMMASAAIPVIFPTVRIQDPENFPELTFMDGGIADDHIPYKAALQYQEYKNVPFEKLIIVSRKSDSVPDFQAELADIGLKDSKLFETIGTSLHHYSCETFIRKLQQFQQTFPELASRTYIYVPDFEENFPMLNFDLMREQYTVTNTWAQKNKPMPLSEYLVKNPIPIK